MYILRLETISPSYSRQCWGEKFTTIYIFKIMKYFVCFNKSPHSPVQTDSVLAVVYDMIKSAADHNIVTLLFFCLHVSIKVTHYELFTDPTSDGHKLTKKLPSTSLTEFS